MTTFFGPHIRNPVNVQTRELQSLFSLSIPFLGCLFIFRLTLLKVFAGLLLGWVAAKLLERLLTPDVQGFRDRESWLCLAILGLILPPELSLGQTALSGFVGVFFGKDAFGKSGGLGFPFHSVLVAHVFSQSVFPDAVDWDHTFIGASIFLIFLLIPSALFLLRHRLISWQAGFAHLAICLCALLFQERSLTGLPSLMLFTSFFIVAQPAGLPSTPKGGAVAGILSGLLALSAGAAHYPQAFAFAFLITQCLNPWIERLLPSKGKRVKR